MLEKQEDANVTFLGMKLGQYTFWSCDPQDLCDYDFIPNGPWYLKPFFYILYQGYVLRGAVFDWMSRYVSASNMGGGRMIIYCTKQDDAGVTIDTSVSVMDVLSIAWRRFFR